MTRPDRPLRNGATRTCRALLLLALAAVAVAPVARAEEAAAQIEATLVLASNEDKPSDPKLKAIEPRLRKIFNFKTYQHYGSGGAKCAVPGETTIALRDDFKLATTLAPAEDNKLRLQIRWTRGSSTLVNTTMVQGRGEPIILGGPAHEGGTLIVSLMVR